MTILPKNLSFSFQGSVVVITGAASGIGKALAEFFVKAGASTVGVDIDISPGVKEQLAPIRAFTADVRDSNSVQDVINNVISEFGRVDILINAAGITRDSMSWKMSDDAWDEVIEVSAGGTFKFSRACIPIFRKQGFGRIINFTSVAGTHGNIGQVNYSTAKAGIIGFTKTAALELAKFGITVNAISPVALTQMLQGVPKEKLAMIEEKIPMGRIARPDEICSAVAFLASQEAKYVTGIVVPVDGGLSI